MFAINSVNPLSPNNTNTTQQNQIPIQRQRSRIPFSHEEDEALRTLVNLYGENNWYFVASQMPNRSVRQCRERWQLFLSSGVTKSKWTREEDELLLSKHLEYGSQWKTLERFFKGRTSYSIRNRFISLSRLIQKFNSNNTNNTPYSNNSNSTTLMTITNTNNSNFSSPFTSSLSSPEETQQNQYFNFSLINQQQQQSQQQENDIAKESESENVELVASADNLNESFCFDEMLTLFDNDQDNEFTDDVYDHDFYCIEL